MAPHVSSNRVIPTEPLHSPTILQGGATQCRVGASVGRQVSLEILVRIRGWLVIEVWLILDASIVDRMVILA